MSRFFFVEMGTPNSIIEGFHELKVGEIPNASLVQPFYFPNRFVALLNRIRYSRRFRRSLRFVPHDWWARWHALRTLPFSLDECNYVVLIPGTDVDRLLLPRLLRWVRTRHELEIKLVLLLFDPIDSPIDGNGWNRVQQLFPLFDVVASFDKRDAESLNIPHFTDPYARRDVEYKRELETDVFFVGHEKGRLDRLCEIANHLRGAGVTYRFLVAGVSNTRKALAHGLTPIAERLSYSEVLKHVVSSRCLLEVLCDGQASSSLRYYEAVVYNKKLLTDNQSVSELPCFNADYIRCFADITDIDTGWIKAPTAVDYRYDGEFSVRRLMDFLERNSTPATEQTTP